MLADSIKMVLSDKRLYQVFPFSLERGVLGISPGNNLETPCTALSDGPSESI